MGLTCGIIGLPNVGKSTLFNALTKSKVAAANYPFCTIEPNTGIVQVPDPRLQQISNIVHPAHIVPTTMQFVDIAGLVKGAAQGEGLGNQFLAHIRETDAILHVVRCFESHDIAHVAGRINPTDDVEIIHTELLLADLATLDKQEIKYSKSAKSGDQDAQKALMLIARLKTHLNQGQPARTYPIQKQEYAFFKQLCLLTAKPTLYIANIKDQHECHLVENLKAYAQKEQTHVIILSAAAEAELIDLDEVAQKEWLMVLGIKEPGLHQVIHTSYDLLHLQTYFTAGIKEVRAWTIPKGTMASQAAGVIHSDFERGFIRAEVISYEDFILYQGEQGAREAGKCRIEGKQYMVCEGDIMYFLFQI